MRRPPAAILAGGEARRMGGGDKGLATLGGRPLLAHALARLAPQAGALALSANGDPARFAEWGLPVLPDAFVDPGGRRPGPLAGILAALDWAAELGEAQVATVPWDTPFLPMDLIARLAEAARAEGAPGALAAAPDPGRPGGWAPQPAVGLWPTALREDLRAALGGGLRKVGAWADRHGLAQARIKARGGPDPFFNINTPADMAEAERLWRTHFPAPAAPPSTPRKDEA
ncbi:molybdenum cofactor guanylyltransferase MobA [Albimonas sp. CAU 1670]|uniref:molybdenum cofactor guanylyltransferase MobA n=1 Tax=Albimonas sp. CAU 1670 TaxID=3032599 RepID=UPI0023DA8C74|nr:molybdenum cofactor guanylyltransferase MobA [Albimonas sp. CAU 1670]MDF2233351.1 molybdenum cofactor guanylyltransferase MobA [Albimonas sp. CAU 1670]